MPFFEGGGGGGGGMGEDPHYETNKSLKLAPQIKSIMQCHLAHIIFDSEQRLSFFCVPH